MERDYDLTYIIKGNLKEEEAKSVINKINNFISENGEILSEKFWGKRGLAYPIEKLKQGYYEIVIFRVKPEFIKKLEENLKMEEEVIRHLIVVKPAQKEKGKKVGPSLKKKKKEIKKEKTEEERIAELDKKLEELLAEEE